MCYGYKCILEPRALIIFRCLHFFIEAGINKEPCATPDKE